MEESGVVENEFGKWVHVLAFLGHGVVTALNTRIRSRGMWRHPCLVEIRVSEERPISISKAENSILIISFHKHLCDKEWKNTHKHTKLLTENLKSCSKRQLFYSKHGGVGSYKPFGTQTPQKMTLILIITAFSTSNLIFMALFNPKQKLNITNQPNSFKTLPSSCVNDTDKWVLQYVKGHYKWLPLYFFSLHTCRKNVENISPSTWYEKGEVVDDGVEKGKEYNIRAAALLWHYSTKSSWLWSSSLAQMAPYYPSSSYITVRTSSLSLWPSHHH